MHLSAHLVVVVVLATRCSFGFELRGGEWESVLPLEMASETDAQEQDVPGPLEVIEAPWSSWALGCFTTWSIWALLGSITAMCCYRHGSKSSTLGGAAGGSPQDIMIHGHFDCFRDVETCYCSFLCPAVRWADTVSMTGMLHGLRPFWPAFAAFVLLTLLNCLMRCWLIFGPLTALGMVYSRHYIRKSLGMTYCTCSTVWLDCCFSMLCPVCAIAQEARAVSQACATGALAGIPVKISYLEDLRWPSGLSPEYISPTGGSSPWGAQTAPSPAGMMPRTPPTAAAPSELN
mmetsp:Transcript_74978/g.139910  ORF Transcript_74978/g.139910 Transcript_74978/m.139910 type:complete len:289 (+) Transcript_74978:88-954(+)